MSNWYVTDSGVTDFQVGPWVRLLYWVFRRGWFGQSDGLAEADIGCGRAWYAGGSLFQRHRPHRLLLALAAPFQGRAAVVEPIVDFIESTAGEPDAESAMTRAGCSGSSGTGCPGRNVP